MDENKIWTVGSRWDYVGNPESSIFSIFRRNSVIFTDSDAFLSDVKVGHYIAISNGYKIVAVARELEPPRRLGELPFLTSELDYQCFFYEESKDTASGSRVNIIQLEKPIDYPVMRRFCCFKQESICDEVVERYREEMAFDVNPYKRTPREMFVHTMRYIIPIYQRPYSWTENEVKPFVADLVRNFIQGEKMFIGTMQLSNPEYISDKEQEQEVIDGQQRLTTLAILLKELNRKCANEADNHINLNLIETRVNKEQNQYLLDYFGDHLSTDEKKVDLNRYEQNARLIGRILDDELDKQMDGEERIPSTSIDRAKSWPNLLKYTQSEIFFIIIETKSTLTQALQIFNVINTTGLDLNAGDIFKIRMFDYLKSKKGMSQELAWDKLKMLYEKIDSINKKAGESIISIGEALQVYQKVLIGRGEMNVTTSMHWWVTFYERLFDCLLGVKDWEHYRGISRKKDFHVDMDEIVDIVDILSSCSLDERRDKWDGATDQEKAELRFVKRFLPWTRYPAHANSYAVFLFYFRNDKKTVSVYDRLLLRLFFAYSITYAKSVYEIHGFMHELETRCMPKYSSEKVISRLREKVSEGVQRLESDNAIAGFITDKVKKKNLICILSAHLDEMEEDKNANIFGKIWKLGIDIEHIHATNDPNPDFHNEGLQDSIGNLVILEKNINRSIKDADFETKKKRYTESQFVSVKKLKDKNRWEKADALARREEEVKKLIKYLKEGVFESDRS